MVSIEFNADISQLSEINDQTDDIVSNLSNVGDTGESAFNDMTNSTETATSELGNFGDMGDQAFDGIEENAEFAADGISDTGTAGTEAMEEISDSTENASGTMGDMGEESKGLFDTLADNWGKVTLAASTAGGFLEKFVREQTGANEALDKTSISTGIASGELRDMAVSMSDSTTSAQDNAGAMDELNKRGIDTKEQFEDLIPQLNDFSSATGKDMAESIESVDRLLSPFGESVEDVGENTDQLTRIMNETDIPIGSFERNLGRVPGELESLGFGLDDAAAGVEVFRDRGFEGKESVREFRRAVDESDGDMGTFLETIGLTNDEWQEYQEKVEPAAGLTEDMSAASDENASIMERAQQSVQNLMFEYGDFAEAAGLLTPVLLGLGPAIKGVQMATALFNTTLLASPITWIIVGITALIATIVLLWTNWDQVSQWLAASWDWLKEKSVEVFTAIGEWISEKFHQIAEVIGDVWDTVREWTAEKWTAIVETISEFLLSIWETITETWNNILTTIGEVLSSIWETITETWNNILTTIGEVLSSIWETITSIWDSILSTISSVLSSIMSTISSIWNSVLSTISSILDSIWSTISSIWDSILSTISNVLSSIGSVISDMFSGFVDTIGEWMNDAWDTIEGVWDDIMGFFEGIDLFSVGADIIQGLVDGIGSMLGAAKDKAMEVATGVKEAITDFFTIKSPSRVMIDVGEDVGAGLQIGLDDSAMQVARSAQDLAEEGDPSFQYTPESNGVSHTRNSRNVYYFSPQTEIHVSGNMTPEQERETERRWKRKVEDWHDHFHKKIEVREV